jgi:hypothetical protein
LQISVTALLLLKILRNKKVWGWGGHQSHNVSNFVKIMPLVQKLKGDTWLAHKPTFLP